VSGIETPRPLGFETVHVGDEICRHPVDWAVCDRDIAWSEEAHELAGYCQSLERGIKGAGRHIYIPRTREALIYAGDAGPFGARQ
jgi:hypothetical protein